MSRIPTQPRRSYSSGAKYLMWRRLLANLSLTLLAVLSLAPGSAQPQAKVNEITPYLKPQLVVSIAEGRTINLVCLGHGSPTVVLIPGLGGWSGCGIESKANSHAELAFVRGIPPGSASAVRAPSLRTPFTKPKISKKALQAAHLDDSYVLVAHSAGAYTAIRFADQCRKAVVGMVLADPSIPGQDSVRERVAPKFAAFGNGAPTAEATRLRQCAAELASRALKRGTPPMMSVRLRRSYSPLRL
jgi:pimeloyl-ACP methyl ester carboxylesterase